MQNTVGVLPLPSFLFHHLENTTYVRLQVSGYLHQGQSSQVCLPRRASKICLHSSVPTIKVRGIRPGTMQKAHFPSYLLNMQ